MTAERTLEQIDRLLVRRLMHEISDEEALNQISELVSAWTDPKDEPPSVIHTTCKYCEQDIEGIEPFALWRDRGNNTRCPDDARRKHKPV